MESVVSRVLHAALAPSGTLSGSLNRFPAVRTRTLEILVDLTPAQAAFAPRPGSWSIAQIADHLLRSEDLYRRQWQRMIQRANEGNFRTIPISFEEVDTWIPMVPRGIASTFQFPLRVFNRFVPAALRETMVRYPFLGALNPKASAPRDQLVLENLRADLAASMKETLELLQGPLPRDLERIRVDHPVMGFNNIVEMFRIMLAHEERHQGQMEGIRKDPRLPKS
jgi:hypothetical protein